MNIVESLTRGLVILILVGAFYTTATSDQKKFEVVIPEEKVISREESPKAEPKMTSLSPSMPRSHVSGVSCQGVERDCVHNSVPPGQPLSPLRGNVFVGIYCENIGKDCVSSPTDQIEIYGLVANNIGRDAVHLGKD